MADQGETTRCGQVALVGRPNVGKSTLLNHLVGQKLAITSRKPQTTRQVLLGIRTSGLVQSIFVDTPGMHLDDRRELNRYMNRVAESAVHDVDMVMMLVDRGAWNREDQRVLDYISESSARRVCIVNKIDRMDRGAELLEVLSRIDALGVFDEIVPLSALREMNLDRIDHVLEKYLPAGPHLYPDDQVTDRDERFFASEIVREKIMRRTGGELPHHTAVVIEEFAEEGDLTRIHAAIVVERAGQKSIVIGKGGERLRGIGSDARADLERLLERKVMLHLWVKVRGGWSTDAGAMRRLGYD